MSNNRRNVHTTLDQNIYKEAKRKAIDFDCNANDIIEVALKEFFQKNPTREEFRSLFC
jgi:hypothetical protein